MKILVFGAGPLDSLFAARLFEADHYVSLSYFDPQTPPMPEDESQIAMNWRAVWLVGGALTALPTLWLYRQRTASEAAGVVQGGRVISEQCEARIKKAG
jgi:hypothetical protein